MATHDPSAEEVFSMRTIKPTVTVASFLAVLALFVASARPVSQDRDANDASGKIAIRPGTALARLVAQAESHQALLAAPQKAPRLKVDIPLWLRSHYRRNHVEMRTAVRANDPTGGFPMALENLYHWMLRHQDLQPVVAPAAPTAATPGAVVGNNVKISGQSDTPRSESDIRINPTKTAQIIAASNNPGGSQQAQYFSDDGGVSWGQSFLPLVAGDSMHSDPTVDWTSDGTAWATTIGISAGTTVLQMRAYKSNDAGKTWVFDATFSGSQTSTDKQQMCVDSSPSSPHRDTIYVIWHNNSPAIINRRTTDGWQVPQQVSGDETTGVSIGSDITTNASGTVFAVWPDTGSQQLFLVRSTDGGTNWSSPPVSVAKTFGSFQISVPAFASRMALIGASIAAYDGNGRNDVYVTWVDLSGDSGCDSPDEQPGDDAGSNCKSRVWFARSTDGGLTWTEQKKQLNPGPARNDQFNQKLRVDPTSGTLGIVYYDTAADSGRKKANLVFQASVDNGTTWSSPIKVTSKQSDETDASADSGNQYGDYNGMSVAGNAFFPSWTDHRDNNPEAVYTAKITVPNSAGGPPQPVIEAIGKVAAAPRGRAPVAAVGAR
jgi:hypothetical protein